MVITILTSTLLQPNSRKQTEWHVVFGHWPADGDCAALHVKYPCSNGSTATVKRIDDTTWTLEAPATDTEVVCLLEYAPVSKNDPDPFKLRARILFPFAMKLTLKP